MAKYTLLIYGDPQQWAAMSPEQQQANDAGHAEFRDAAGSRILGGNELEPAGMATTVRADAAGRVVTTDGPFLETKEALGGYYELEAADLDEALGLAARLPEVRAGHCAVEVRPVVDHG
jgi:hypothetical protein